MTPQTVGSVAAVGRSRTERLLVTQVTSDGRRRQPDELIVWDNRCLMHRATEYDPAVQRRVIRRCTVLGEVPH